MTKTNDNEIKDSIIKNRPNITQSSLKTYMSNIRNVSKTINKPLNTINDIVDNHKDIFDSLIESNINNRKTKLSSMIVAIDSKHNNTKDIDNILEMYRKKFKEDKEVTDKKESNQELTESQKKNFIPWKEVETIYKNLKSEAEGLFKLERINQAQFKKLQEYVLLSLYVLIPPRRSLDYASFKIRNVDKDKDNFMTMIKRKPHLVFNQYKNSSRIGKQEVSIPTTLKTILTKWISKNPYDYLIVNSLGKPITQSKINSILNGIFGKNIGSSLLRHIYLTDKYGKVHLADLEKDTKAMGNSDIRRSLTYVGREEAKKE
jgi:hypothetical protein